MTVTEIRDTMPTITDQNAENLLETLVRAYSPSGHEQRAAQTLVNWMNRHGYDDAFVDAAGNAVGIIGQGSRDVMLLGHIDTFGGDLAVRREDRVLYGRGTVDAKGPLCTFAVAALRAQLPSDVRVIVVGAVEEEAASSKGARFIADQYRPSLCIIGEPSQWDRITLGYKGRLLIDWRWDGALSHSAADTLTAPERAVAYWEQVRATVADINAGRQGIFARLDATLQDIGSGQRGAFGWATLTVGLRLPPDLTPQAVADLLHSDADGVQIRAYGHERAFVAERDTVISRALRGAIRSQGGTPRFVHKTGTSDMNIVGARWGCPIVAYGAGDSALDHTPQEHINLDEYLRAIDVLADALGRL